MNEPQHGTSQYPAYRFDRGGVSVYVVAMPIRAVSLHLPIPDPTEPFQGNRRVDGAHAEGFAQYWKQNERWAAPPLLLDSRVSLRKWFAVNHTTGGVAHGVLTVPDTSVDAIKILDGQHRILGWSIAVEQIEAEYSTARRLADQALRAGEARRIREAETRLERAEQARNRLRHEHVTVEIYEKIDEVEHGQFFSDIAINAKGINKSVLASLDQRDIVNRVASDLAESQPLLKGLVDFEKDRMTVKSESFISAKNLGDVIRAAAIGPESRATQRREERMRAADVSVVSVQFLEVLEAEIGDVRRLAAGDVTPSEIRARSLIASPTILRCLAGAFRELAVSEVERDRPQVDPEGVAVFRRLLGSLDRRLGFPIEKLWFSTGHFPTESSKAPSSRVQDIRGLTNTLVMWGQFGVPPRT
ncbi:DNA sulfur modification protein DndB [Georgenia muralis]|uniref:DndB-like DNA-sulfur modification-associated protein n=1 Tax=Georgenia muralis TaxID=154117 RepID=A0A3N4Z4V1_9MICO|nr:DNA sulfur modification protein DndB [Georgenia muralis]RPF26944.1 DndB-like DNA-sulfur modification-associated protein [Georgenia muralis]